MNNGKIRSIACTDKEREREIHVVLAWEEYYGVGKSRSKIDMRSVVKAFRV